MSFEELLANCIQAIEAGESIEDCLVKYPSDAAELEPLLRLLTAVRKAPPIRLSAEAFERGRQAVAEMALAQQASPTQGHMHRDRKSVV